jgi:hypothetical protein
VDRTTLIRPLSKPRICWKTRSANSGTVIEPIATYTVPLTPVATPACPSPPTAPLSIQNFVTEDPSFLSLVEPLVQPVSAAQSVVGGSVADPLFGSGRPVTVSWTAPAIANVPTAYRILVFRLFNDCQSPFFGGQLFWVPASQTTAVIPPELFSTSDGTGQYAVVVRAYWWDDTTDPSKVGNIFGGQRRGVAEAFAGTLLH